MATSTRQPLLVSSTAVAERIAKTTDGQPRSITVAKMVGTKDVAQFMRLVATAKTSTRKMGMIVR